jgi:hypothetical protein
MRGRREKRHAGDSRRALTGLLALALASTLFCSGLLAGKVGEFSFAQASEHEVVVNSAFLGRTSTNDRRSTHLADAPVGPSSFGVAALWATDFCFAGMQCAMGDFNGDGRDDIIQFNREVSPAGAVYVALSNGSSFGAAQGWNATPFCEQAGDVCQVGDFNGDGKDDIIGFRRSSGQVSVALAKTPGPGFNVATIWKTAFCLLDEICDVGDYDGDGRADIAIFLRSNVVGNIGYVYVALSRGADFGTAVLWADNFCIEQEICGSGDVNADGMDDLIAFRKVDGVVYVARSDGTKFTKLSSPWIDSFCPGLEVCGVGDFNGDRKNDVITYLQSLESAKGGWVYVAPSNGSSFLSSGLWTTSFCTGSELCGSGNSIDGLDMTSYSQVAQTGDFDGDGFDDAITFLRSTDLSSQPGYVYVASSDGLSPTTVFLPLVARNLISYFDGPWEVEPNNDWQHANGPVRSGRDYYGYPDQKDYWSVYLPANGTITADLTNHTGQDVQNQLHYGQPVQGAQVAWAYSPPYHIEYSGQAGWYYVYINGGSGWSPAIPYTLRASYP